MSYSSLFGINKDYIGKELYEYGNSWLFSPLVWDVLSKKYIPSDVVILYGYQKPLVVCPTDIWDKLNNKINNCNNTPDRICWEMSQQQIFFTKDKELIADSICEFVKQNKAYDKIGTDELHLLEEEHIIERFSEIANNIRSLNEEVYPYFVFKNTSVDDVVCNWFYDYDEDSDKYIDKSLKDWDILPSEFVVIENDEVARFIINLDYVEN